MGGGQICEGPNALGADVGELSGHLTPLPIGPVCLVSQGRFEEPVHCRC